MCSLICDPMPHFRANGCFVNMPNPCWIGKTWLATTTYAAKICISNLHLNPNQPVQGRLTYCMTNPEQAQADHHYLSLDCKHKQLFLRPCWQAPFKSQSLLGRIHHNQPHCWPSAYRSSQRIAAQGKTCHSGSPSLVGDKAVSCEAATNRGMVTATAAIFWIMLPFEYLLYTNVLAAMARAGAVIYTEVLDLVIKLLAVVIT